MSKILKISKTAILKTIKFENQLNFAKIIAKNLAKIEKPPFWKTQNMKISPAKIQKSVGKKSGQLARQLPKLRNIARGGKTFWR